VHGRRNGQVSDNRFEDYMVEQRKWYLNTDTDAVEYLARVMCSIAGMDPINTNDGDPNWYLFNEEATNVVNGIRKRFPVGNLRQSE
jgi:hypothetical protein